MRHLFKIGVLIFTVSWPSLTSARLIVYGKARETINVVFGVETLFRFPMEVKTVTEASRFEIRPSNPDEPDFSVLMIKPRMSEGTADVAFLLSDGSVIRTQLTILNPNNSNGSTRTSLKKDSIYDFKPKDELLNSNLTNPNLSNLPNSPSSPNSYEKHDPMTISELDLMRAMIQGENVSGFNLSRHSRPISMGSSHLYAKLIKIYSGKEVNGYVYLLKTDGPEHVFEIDVRGIAIGQPNLAVLAQVDRPKLGGKSPEDRQTFLRIVAKPGASSQKIILPVSIRTEDKNSKTL